MTDSLIAVDQRNAAGSCKPESDEEFANRLMRFYSVDSLHALIRMQDRHIEKLQSRLPRPSLSDDVAFHRVREG